MSFYPEPKILPIFNADSFSPESTSESSTATSSTDDLSIRRGLVEGVSLSQYGGYSSSVGTTEQSIGPGIWGKNGIYIISFPAVPTIMAMASESINDTSAGTGAQQVLINYLDSNFDPQTEILTLNGTTPVATVAQMCSIVNLTVIAAGSLLHADGNIYVGANADTWTAGGPDTNIYEGITAGANLSANAHLTVPNGKLMFFDSSYVDTDASGTKYLTTTDKVQFFGNPITYFGFVHTHTAPFQFTIKGAGSFPAGTHVYTTAQSSSGTIRLLANWTYYLVDA